MYTIIITDPVDQIYAEGIWNNKEEAEWDRNIVLDKLESTHPDFGAEVIEINWIGRIDTKAKYTILFDTTDSTGEHDCYGLFQNKEDARNSWLADNPGYGNIKVIPFVF